MDNMEEKKEETAEDLKKIREENDRTLKENLEAIRAKSRESTEAMSQGKGKLELEHPIRAGGKEVTELAYDFTVMTGMEYTDAMDSDPNASQIFRITYRQGLNLFAKAAAKQTEGVDQRDILEQIGMTDAVEGVQLATLFFSASARAGRMRISKM